MPIKLLSQPARSFRMLVLAVLVFLTMAPMSVDAQDVTQGYSTNGELLLRGTVVVYDENDENVVAAATLDTLERLFGVVVRSNESPLLLSGEDNGAFVSTSGRFEVLVSNVNGEIQQGDYITASAVAGVAMKADQEQDIVLGQALSNFDTTNPANVLSTSSVNLDDGGTKPISIGRVLTQIDVRASPLQQDTVVVEAPNFLINLGESIADKPVTPLRIYAALAMLLVSFGLGGSLLYSSIRSSIVAIGRNPLSKSSVMKQLIQVILVSFGIFAAGFIAVYLVLTV